MNLLFESLKKIDHFCSFVVLQTSSQTFLDRPYVAISYPVTSLVPCRNLSSDLSAIKDLSKESLLEDLKSEEEVDSNLSK